MDEFIIVLLVVIYAYTLFSIISVILLENRNPVRSLAWMMVLILLPVLGIVLYLILGQNYRKQKLITKKRLKFAHERKIFEFDPDSEQLNYLKSEHKRLIKLLHQNNESIGFADNNIEILSEGEQTFESMFEAIKNAKQHIHLEFFIFGNDNISNQLRELLILKAKEGIRIRMIYDYFGSFVLSSKYLLSLKEAGIYVKPFLPLRLRLNRSKINFRNHRKLLIVDGKFGFTGGINVADRYIFGNRLGKWRDTFVKFEGRVVHGLQLQFLADWHFVAKKLIKDPKYYPPAEKFRKNIVQIVSSGPDNDWEAIMQGIAYAITSSTKYIYIHTPYFVPNEVVMHNLQIAALSGIDVRLMIPKESDSRLSDACTFSYLGEALESGIKIYIYQKGFLHSKAIVIDDFVSIVGSANLDERSFNLNFETNAFIYEQKTAEVLKDLFHKDMQNSVELSLEDWQNRRRRQKLKESFARLFSPII